MDIGTLVLSVVLEPCMHETIINSIVNYDTSIKVCRLLIYMKCREECLIHSECIRYYY